MSVTTSVNPTKHLDWEMRPEPVQKQVQAAFEHLSQQDDSKWGYNGDKWYSLCGIEEYDLLKKIIERGYPEQKEFYFLDIGAGSFIVDYSLVRAINDDRDVPSDVRVHILGVRGEKLENPVRQSGQKAIGHHFGSFKCEELSKEFKKLGFQLENKVDFIISRWSFRHFVDPVGTFAQALQMLRPKSGLMAMDGFFFLLNEERFSDKLDSLKPQLHMLQLLFDAQVSFVANFYNVQRSLDHFIIQRTSELPCRLPMTYSGISEAENAKIYSRFATRFIREIDTQYMTKYVSEGRFLQGDKPLYNWLRESGLTRLQWKPILQSQQPEEKLHHAIIQGESIDVNGDINEPSGETGSTPLLLTVQHDRTLAFETLLSHKANPNLANYENQTPLVVAVRIPDRVKYIEPLLDSGADTAAVFDVAIREKNFAAIAILLKHQLPLSIENEEALLSPEFSSLGEARFVRPVPSYGPVSDIEKWVNGGDCVILSAKGHETFCYAHTETPRRVLYLVEYLDGFSYSTPVELADKKIKLASLELAKQVPASRTYHFSRDFIGCWE